jgi:hypothetical protein
MKTLEDLIREANRLWQHTLHSDSADHLRLDFREAWDFVKAVAAIDPDEARIASVHKGSGTCKACKAKVKWIKTASGASMPLDAKPIKYYRKATTPLKYIQEEGYTTHWATCPEADKFRKKK